MAGSNQFLVSMKFVGVDALSPEIKKINDQVKGLKSQMNSVSKGPSGGFKFIDNLNKGLTTALDSLDKLDSKLKNLKSSGLENMVTGGALLASVMKPLNTAGQLQTNLVTIQDTTGASQLDLNQLKSTITATSNATRYSSLEVSDMAKQLKGLSVQQINQLLPTVGRYAEVQQFTKGASYDESVTDAVSAAHMLGIYDPNRLDSFLNDFNRATQMTPGTTSEFFDTFKYLAPQAEGLKMSNSDIVYTSALANRVGILGSMGGTQAADMLLRSIPGIFGGQGTVDKNGKFKPSQQLKAMMDLGLASSDGSSVFFDNQGQFKGVQNFIDQLATAAKSVNPEQLTKDFKNMFGMQGDKLAVLFSERGGEQLQLIQQQMDNVKNLTDFQSDLNNTYEGKLQQFVTNVQNFEIAVGNHLLPTATKFITTLGPYLDTSTQWVTTHKDEVTQIAKVSTELGGFLLLLGAGKLALGTIGSLVLDPLKAGVQSIKGIIDTIAAKSVTTSKSLPEQSIQANIVNVYGKSVIGGGSVPGVIKEPGGGSATILGPNGKPISSGAAAAAEDAAQAAKSGVMKNALNAVKSGLRGSLYTSLLVGGFDVATGQSFQTAAKNMGGTIGGWAGAEAGATFGAAIGTAVGGPVGTAVGGVIGGVIGGFAGQAMVSKMTDALVNFKNSAELNLKADLTKYAQQEGQAIKQQYASSYTDNSTTHFNIQSSAPKEVANEVQSKQNDGNMSKGDWMRHALGN